jgi:hypothetical protein
MQHAIGLQEEEIMHQRPIIKNGLDSDSRRWLG